MKISIITVNYNDIEGLKRTFNSVFFQNYQEFEYIVIDGGSTDGSKDIIEQNSDKINYWISEPDSGVYQAMNKGILKATGEYLFFLNSGDTFKDEFSINRIIPELENEDFIYFDIESIEGNNKEVLTYPDSLSFEYLHDDVPCHQSTFIKKGMFEKYGLYDEKLRIVSDWKFFILAICKYNATYKHVSSVVTNFYKGGLSSSVGSYEKMKLERATVLENEFKIFLEDLKTINSLKRLIRSLRKSKKSQFLIKLKLLNDF